MCGICGAIPLTWGDSPVLSDGALERMNGALIHRGPDDSGVHVDGGLAIGARRLSIVDVQDGHQPVANEAGTVWAAQNGELFNQHEQRAWLEGRGHRFTSRCDTEIIPHLYEELGADFAARLRGMFAIVVWDAVEHRGVLVRDRLGIKPLYYTEVENGILFASELKALLASGRVETGLDYEAVDAYLTLGFFPGPATPLRAVRKLMPGHRIVVENGGYRVEQWWTYPRPQADARTRSEAEWAELLLDKLRESVRLRLMSDVPLGAMLSGGLDSSLLVALMAELMSEPVKTFSVGFAGEDNELDDARTVARLNGTDHHELELSLDTTTSDLADLVWHMDEPVADLSAIGFMKLCGLARQHVTVALSGQGADELLGGYRKHRAAALLERWHLAAALARRPARAVAPHLSARYRRAVATVGAGDASTRLLSMSGLLDLETRRRIARGRLTSVSRNAALHAANSLGPPEQPLAGTLFLDAQLGLVDDMLHYFDRTSMAHSLEVRVPFLDHEFVELCATVPARLKVNGGVTKYILRAAARGRVPDHVIDKPKVGFFNAAVDRWFDSQARGAAREVLLDPGARYAELIDRSWVEETLESHESGLGTRSQHSLLAVLMLELWLSEFMPRAAGLGEGAPGRDRPDAGVVVGSSHG
jgi:asparagine synthase (glutamine-hydrolysing)